MARRPTLPPFVKILPLVVGGILLGRLCDIEAWKSGLGAIVCILCAVIWRKKFVGGIYMGAGIILMAMTTTLLRTTPTSLPYDQSTTTTATITSPTTIQGRWYQTDAIIRHNDHNHKVILRSDTTLAPPRLSEQGVLTTMVRRLPDNSYGKLMQNRGYSAICYTWRNGDWKPQTTTTSPVIWAQKCRNKMVERLEQLALTPRDNAVAKAMTLGIKSDIDNDLRKSYSRSGCAHLLAISGLHVGIVAMLVWALLWFMPLVSRRGHIWRNVAAIVAMLVYAVLTGMSPSVMRATLMFCTAQLTMAWGGNRSSTGALCAALGLMLLVNPNNLFDISFQLSALAVVGIMVGAGPLMAKVKSNNRVLNTLWGTVVIGLCAMVATMPLVAHTFGLVGFAGIATNPLMILTANVIVLGSLIWIVAPIELFRPIVGWVVGGCTELQNRSVEAASNIDWLVLKCSPPQWLIIMLYATMFGLIVVAHYHKDRVEWRLKR